MATLADLQPDRRAVLQLLVGRGRGYDQIAELLHLSEIVVRRRAHDAITELAGGKGTISDPNRALLCDYLVGELPASRRAEARTLLAEDPAARRFARGAAARLSGIEGAQLPELPAEDDEVAEALDALDQRRERRQELDRESKLGAWLVVGGIAAAVIAAVIVLAIVVGNGNSTADTDIPGPNDAPAQTGGANDDSSDSGDNASTTARPIVAADLTPPSGGEARGQVALQERSQGGPVKIALQATGLQPPRSVGDGRRTDYAFWLIGPSAQPLNLGFYSTKDSPQAQQEIAAGRVNMADILDGSGAPAVDANDLNTKYDEVLVTRETVTTRSRPSQPGTVVLRGKLFNTTA